MHAPTRRGSPQPCASPRAGRRARRAPVRRRRRAPSGSSPTGRRCRWSRWRTPRCGGERRIPRRQTRRRRALDGSLDAGPRRQGHQVAGAGVGGRRGGRRERRRRRRGRGGRRHRGRRQRGRRHGRGGRWGRDLGIVVVPGEEEGDGSDYCDQAEEQKDHRPGARRPPPLASGGTGASGGGAVGGVVGGARWGWWRWGWWRCGRRWRRWRCGWWWGRWRCGWWWCGGAVWLVAVWPGGPTGRVAPASVRGSAPTTGLRSWAAIVPVRADGLALRGRGLQPRVLIAPETARPRTRRPP